MRSRTIVIILLVIVVLVCLVLIPGCFVVMVMMSGESGDVGVAPTPVPVKVTPTPTPMKVAPTLAPIGIAPSGGSDHYWTCGCVSADEAVLGAVGDEAALVDLESGQTRQQTEGYFDAVFCFPNGEVVAVSGSGRGLFSVRDATWEQWDKSVRNVVGPLADRRIVTFYQDYTTTSGYREYRGPITLFVSRLGPGDESKSFELHPDLFSGLGQGSEIFFRTIPVRILDDEQVLVAAGFKPNFSFGKVQPLPWGFFTVDLSQDQVTPLGPPRTGDDVVNLYLSSGMGATPDGKTLAVAMQQPEWERQVAVVGLRSDTAQETFRVMIEDAKQVNQIRLNQSGDLLAVVIDQSELYVFDGQTGQLLWAGRHAGGSIYLLQFLSDDSLVVMTSQRTTSRISGRDGQVLWESWANE